LEISITDDKKWATIDGIKLPIFSVNSGKTSENHYVLYSVPIDQLERDLIAQPREIKEEEADDIAKSITDKVIMQPIMARYDSKTKHGKITEGQHRWRAMQKLGEKRIPAILYLTLDDFLAVECGIDANWTDRARKLAGGDASKKIKAAFQQASRKISEETGKPAADISEADILERLGIVSRGEQRKYIRLREIQDLLDNNDSKIKTYVAGEQDSTKPLTVLNLEFFVNPLGKFTPLTNKDTDLEYLRTEELKNLVQITNIFTDIVLDGEVGKWDPSNETGEKHQKAAHRCKRHPLEAIGLYVADILKKAGAPSSTSPAFYEHGKIDFQEVRKKMHDLLSADVWDDVGVHMLRNIEDIQNRVNRVVKV